MEDKVRIAQVVGLHCYEMDLTTQRIQRNKNLSSSKLDGGPYSRDGTNFK